MKLSANRAIWLIFVGVAVAVVLRVLASWLGTLAVSSDGSVIASWFLNIGGIVDAIVSVLPAFLIGLLAQSRGALLGFLVGASGSVIYTLLFGTVWGAVTGTGIMGYAVVIVQLVVWSLGSGIVGMVSGMAGQLGATNANAS